MSNKLSGSELAARIDAHLKRFAADHAINRNTLADGTGLSKYYNTSAFRSGSWIGVIYVSYQGSSKLTYHQAAKYLEMLDAGFVGRHFEAFRSINPRVT